MKRFARTADGIAGIKVIVQPVVVPVPLTIVPVEVQGITVAR